MHWKSDAGSLYCIPISQSLHATLSLAETSHLPPLILNTSGQKMCKLWRTVRSHRFWNGRGIVTSIQGAVGSRETCRASVPNHSAGRTPNPTGACALLQRNTAGSVAQSWPSFTVWDRLGPFGTVLCHPAPGSLLPCSTTARMRSWRCSGGNATTSG